MFKRMRKKRTVRILIIGHEGIVRDSLALVLSSQTDVVCMGSDEPSDVILLNHDTAWDQPLDDLIDQAARDGAVSRVLVLTVGLDHSIAVRLVRRGVGGLWLKHNSLRSLLEALHIVADGGTWLDAAYSVAPSSPADNGRQSFFTERELRALRSLLEGCSNKEIGARLGSSESAAKGLLQRLFRKTSVRSRGQLIRVALEKYRDLL